MSEIRAAGARVRRVEEMANRTPISNLTTDRQLIERCRSWLAPHFLDDEDFWAMQFQSWILEIDGRIFVIDPCNGNGRPHAAFPMFDMLETPYLERFAAAGVRPEDVDVVFCTHFHHDHCGWNTQLRDGRFVPTFPNARYVFVRREYERWNPARAGHREVAFNIGVFERSIEPVMAAGLAELVEDRHRISPSVAIEPAYGHTMGHSILHLTNDGEEAYFSGDVIHHPIQIADPEVHFFGCDSLPDAIATRRGLIDTCARSGALIIPAHFPAPHAGWIRRASDGGTVFEAYRSGVG